MEKSVLSERFGELFISYVKSPKEEHLSEISELGRSLVMCSIPPEDIADIFEESLILLTRDLPGATLLDTAERISTPLTEMLIGYGIAFREQLAQRQNYENTKLATKVIENALEGIWVADSKGQILIANPVFSHLTGYSLEEAVGQNFIIFHDFCSARENSEMWESIEKNGWWKAEVCGRRKNSETFSALLSISVIRDESLRILNYIGFLSDITERKRHEEITALEISRARQIHDQVTQ
ncbi:MAG: PAS domain S-box protein, partial [Syntrophobacteraceae bacterium]